MRFLFGEHSIDTGLRELCRGGDPIPIEPQVFDLLLHLLHNRDRVVSKDDLLQAVWGGRIVSEATIDSRIKAVRQAVGDSGETQRVIRTIPRKGYRFVAALTDAPQTATAPQPLPLPDRPSIAVLPFDDLSEDATKSYFADGITEDIITALARIRSLFVIARNSTFTYKGRAVDVRAVGRELGVRYVLEGSVRRAGNRVRFTAQLVEAATGTHIWADRTDGTIDDLFTLQDHIAETVAGIMEPTIQQAEIERVRRKPPENLDAYDHYLKGLALTDTFTPEAVQAMLDHCLRAVALDAGFAPAYALAARAYIQRKVQGYATDAQADARATLDLVERGLRADRSDANMLGTAGQCFAWFAYDLAKGIGHIDEAIARNPNLAHVYMQSGIVRTQAGQALRAIEHLDRAQRLNPRDSRNYAVFAAKSLAWLLHGDRDAAYDWARRAVQHNANYLPGWMRVAAAAGLRGRDDEAHAAVRRALAIRADVTIAVLQAAYPIGAPEAFVPYWDGLRRAGLPE